MGGQLPDPGYIACPPIYSPILYHYSSICAVDWDLEFSERIPDSQGWEKVAIGGYALVGLASPPHDLPIQELCTIIAQNDN